MDGYRNARTPKANQRTNIDPQAIRKIPTTLL